MTTSRLAQIAARLIASVSRGLGRPPPPAAGERERAIFGLRQALQARARRNQRRTLLTVAAGATAIAAAVTLVVSLRGGQDGILPFGKARIRPPTAGAQSIRAWGTHLMASRGSDGASDSEDSGQGFDMPDGVPVQPGQTLDARGPDGARLALSGGTTLHLTPQARIDIRSMGEIQKFGLARGRLHADVAPLDAGQRFLIETPDGEIEVHGTVFELAVVRPQPGCAVATTTRVAVSRGIVEVRSAGRDDFVRAGQHWPPECEAMVAPARAAASRAHAPEGEVKVNVNVRSRANLSRPIIHARPAAGRGEPSVPSDLAAQNDLFGAAMSAKEGGQTRRALDELDRLIARFPRGQLAEAAQVERMRLLTRTGDWPAARRQARAYLQSFPDGFAASEAHVALDQNRGAR